MFAAKWINREQDECSQLRQHNSIYERKIAQITAMPMVAGCSLSL
jgi:hypothetical protein